jgi:hypothetical protein
MRTLALQTILRLLVFACASSWGDEFALLYDPLTDTTSAVSKETAVETAGPLAPRSKVFSDFRARLQEAVSSGDVVAIQSLYQTNGVAAESLKIELTQWDSMLRNTANPRVGLYFKELSRLPPKAREVWTKIAEGLTKREVTHLVGVSVTPGTVQRILPLILIEDSLWIVPSDTQSAQRSIEPGGRANGSQPIPSSRDGTQDPAGSRR